MDGDPRTGRGRHPLDGPAAAGILLYATLSAAQGVAVTKALRGPTVWCGNLVSDPFSFLVNWAAPFAAACAIWLLWRGLGCRQRPVAAIAVLVTFLATTGGLIAEGMWLEDAVNLPLARIWWWPWL